MFSGVYIRMTCFTVCAYEGKRGYTSGGNPGSVKRGHSSRSDGQHGQLCIYSGLYSSLPFLKLLPWSKLRSSHINATSSRCAFALLILVKFSIIFYSVKEALLFVSSNLSDGISFKSNECQVLFTPLRCSFDSIYYFIML